VNCDDILTNESGMNKDHRSRQLNGGTIKGANEPSQLLMVIAYNIGPTYRVSFFQAFGGVDIRKVGSRKVVQRTFTGPWQKGGNHVLAIDIFKGEFPVSTFLLFHD
jgi:hypothetical protein